MALLKNTPVYEIHEVTPEILKRLEALPNEAILTFDDGLYSQFKYIDALGRLPQRKIFYISTGIINNSNASVDNISASEAHKEFFKEPITGQKYYMTWDQIKSVNSRRGFYIGMHGHMHLKAPKTKDMNLRDRLNYFKDDVRLMLDMFLKYFPDGSPLRYFQSPYNEYSDEQIMLIEKYKKDCNLNITTTEFKNRIPI